MSSEQRVWDIPFGPLFGEVHNTLTAPCPLADHRINRRECQNRKFDAALDGYVQRFTSRPGSASVVSLLGATLMSALEDGDFQMGVNRVAPQRFELELHRSFWCFLKSTPRSAALSCAPNLCM
jgi:hypothetical protein